MRFHGIMPTMPRITKKDLSKLYHSEQLSAAGIANRLGVSRQYVLKLMGKYKITRRSRKIARQVALKNGRVPGPPSFRKKWLKHLEGDRIIS